MYGSWLVLGSCGLGPWQDNCGMDDGAGELQDGHVRTGLDSCLMALKSCGADYKYNKTPVLCASLYG